MSIDISETLLKMLSSHTKQEVLAVFRKHSDLKYSIPELASRIGSSTEELVHEVNDLMELGLLRLEGSGDTALFSWNRERDEAIQRAICNALLRDESARKLEPHADVNAA